MKLIRIFLLLAFLGLFPLKGQWFEQYIYLPDSFGGGYRYGNRYIVWNSIDDRIYLFGTEGNTVEIDCRTDEKIDSPLFRNTYFGNNVIWNPINNSIYVLYLDSIMIGYDYAFVIVVFDCALNQVVSEIPSIIPNPSCRLLRLTVNSINNKIYFSMVDSLIIIDGQSNQIVGGLKFEPFSRPPIWNSNNNLLYLFTQNKKVIIVDCNSNQIIDTLETEPFSIQLPGFFDRFRNKIIFYGSHNDEHKIFIIDCERNQITDTIPSPSHLVFLDYDSDFNPITNKLYIGNGIIYGVDLNWRTVDTILTGKSFGKIVVNSLNNRLIGYSNKLVIIDCNNNQIIDTIPYIFTPDPTYPWFNFIHPFYNKLYSVAEPYRLTIFDACANYYIKAIKTGANVNDILWNPLTNRLYCSDNEEPLIMVFDGATNRTLGSINLKPLVGPAGIGALAVATQMNKIYASCGEGSIVTIDGNTDSVIRVITQLPDNVYFSYNPNNNKLYATPPLYSQTRFAYVIDCSTDLIIAEIETGFPRYAFINLLTDKVYITGRAAAKTLVVDGAGDTVIKTLDSISGDIVFRYPGNQVYISGGERYFPHNPCFTVLDGYTDTIIAQISKPEIILFRFAYDSIDDRVYGAGLQGIWVLDCQTNQIIDSLKNDSIGEWGFLFWNRYNNKLYYNPYNSDNDELIKVLDCRTNQIVAEFPETQRAIIPFGWNSIDNRFYAEVFARSKLSVIRDFLTSVNEDKFNPLTEPKLEISQPNPFSKKTIIRFQIARREMVNLKVYDTAGKLIRTLKENIENPGYHSLIWDGRDNNNNRLSSGIYFLRLETKGYKVTKKIILAK